MEYLIAENREDFLAAKKLFRQYADWLSIDLCFQHFEEELADLQKSYPQEAGGIILCKDGPRYAGCVALRRIDNQTAELKRMYVKDNYRKAGIGTELLKQSFQLAKERGYKKIRLDTLSHMEPAIRLYRKFGFREIQPYYHNPESSAVFFEKSL